MYLNGVLLCLTLGSVHSGFVQDIRGRGLDVGGGLSMHLDTVKTEPNASLLERHALRIDYQGLGVRLGKAKHDDAFEVGFYYDEGRGKKNQMSDYIVPALLGYKTTTLVIFSMAAISMFVIKAIIIAKMALLLSLILWAAKIFKHEHKSGYGGIELDHHPSELHPVYAEYPGDLSSMGYSGYSANSFVAFPNEQYETDHNAAASAAKYAYVEAPENATDTDTTTQSLQSRKDISRKVQPVQTYITVRRKTVTQK